MMAGAINGGNNEMMAHSHLITHGFSVAQSTGRWCRNVTCVSASLPPCSPAGLLGSDHGNEDWFLSISETLNYCVGVSHYLTK